MVIKRFFASLLMLLGVSALAATAETPRVIRMAVLSVDPIQIETYARLANRFEAQYPTITLHIDYFSDENYKRQLPHWLEEGQYDLLYWQAGKRLKRLVDDGLVAPISGLIETSELRRHLPQSALESVQYNGFVQGVPFAQYSWGFYYNKPIFEQLNLSPPTTWEEFILVCQTLLSNGIPPLVQANQEDWPTLAWLDYLSLQAGGLDYRRQLLEGETGDGDAQARMLGYFNQLIEGGYFFAPEHPWRWQQTIPALVRKRAAMTLMGQFAETIIDPKLSDQLGFFPFPSANTTGVDITPMEVFVVAQASHNKELVKSFLRFLLKTQQQNQLALDLGWLPVNTKSASSSFSNPRHRIAVDHLAQIKHQTQYFDRDTTAEISQGFSRALVRVLARRNIVPLRQLLNGNTSRRPFNQINASNQKRLDFSTLHGHKSSFLVSSLLRDVYERLGYSISVTRFPTTQAAIKSQAFGMDGDLIRIREFEAKSDALVRVPESLVSSTILRVSRKPHCSISTQENQPQHTLGISSDAIVLKRWADQQALNTKMFQDEHQMWQAFDDAQIQHLLLFETDLSDYANNDFIGCIHKELEIPLYHYLNKRHENLVDAVAKEIRAYKNSEVYERKIRRFGGGL